MNNFRTNSLTLAAFAACTLSLSFAHPVSANPFSVIFDRDMVVPGNDHSTSAISILNAFHFAARNNLTGPFDMRLQRDITNFDIAPVVTAQGSSLQTISTSVDFAFAVLANSTADRDTAVDILTNANAVLSGTAALYTNPNPPQPQQVFLNALSTVGISNTEFNPPYHTVTTGAAAFNDLHNDGPRDTAFVRFSLQLDSNLSTNSHEIDEAIHSLFFPGYFDAFNAAINPMTDPQDVQNFLDANFVTAIDFDTSWFWNQTEPDFPSLQTDVTFWFPEASAAFNTPLLENLLIGSLDYNTLVNGIPPFNSLTVNTSSVTTGLVPEPSSLALLTLASLLLTRRRSA